MSYEEYFKDWTRIIDKEELWKAINKVNPLYKSRSIMPEYTNIFKAFTLCSYKDLKAVFLGQDPYPQKDVATGILFGNNKETPDNMLSPSLKVIRNSVQDLEDSEICCTFDPTLESWARQGILMLNSSLTVEENKAGSHSMIWREVISTLLRNLSEWNAGIIYVLFGSQAQTFEPYINSKRNDIIKVRHPAYYARTGEDFPSQVFAEINSLCKKGWNTTFKWIGTYDNNGNVTKERLWEEEEVMGSY